LIDGGSAYAPAVTRRCASEHKLVRDERRSRAQFLLNWDSLRAHAHTCFRPAATLQRSLAWWRSMCVGGQRGARVRAHACPCMPRRYGLPQRFAVATHLCVAYVRTHIHRDAASSAVTATLSRRAVWRCLHAHRTTPRPGTSSPHRHGQRGHNGRTVTCTRAGTHQPQSRARKRDRRALLSRYVASPSSQERWRPFTGCSLCYM
jgi:hypothetical protein